MYANTTGANNTAIGYFALDSNTTAAGNFAAGYKALEDCTVGHSNAASGAYALFNVTDGDHNTGHGYGAGSSVTTGGANTFIGSGAGDSTDDGEGNVAVGYQALSGNCGNDNTVVGKSAAAASTGHSNTCVGQAAGNALSDGFNNLFLGKDSGRSGSPGGNFTSQDNIIVLGDEAITAANIQVDWTVASDQRDKTDFTALDLGLDFVKALAPVTYKWDKRSKYGDKNAEDYDITNYTPDGTHKEDWLDIGFKAQEVQALEEAAGYTTAAKKNLTVSTSDDGKQMGLQYSKFIPILVKAMQEQNALIEALTARITTLEG
jgi:hypothetical protein